MSISINTQDRITGEFSRTKLTDNLCYFKELAKAMNPTSNANAFGVGCNDLLDEAANAEKN